MYIFICLYIHMCTYIYIYIERERGYDILRGLALRGPALTGY